MSEGAPIEIPAPEPVPEGDWGRLVPVSTLFQGDQFPLRKTVIIVGRGDDADLKLDRQGLSRHHAIIRFNARRKVFFVLDNASKNGIYLNKKKVVSHDLAHLDVIHFHSEAFRFEWVNR